MSLTDSVLRTIERHGMVPPGGRVVVALSGGPDSVALVHILRQLEARGHLVVAGLAHFNHQLRGTAADEDEQFCRDLAARLRLPIETARADVRGTARAEKRSIEDAARRLRYAFLHDTAASMRADAIAVGHSRDDQAETFLLRLLRGAGTRGLGSIRPKAGKVVRPLIDVARAELRQFAAAERLTFREDETNADLRVPRNRVRHELLPYLAREFSPGIVEVLAREAALARDDEDRLTAEAIELAATVVLADSAWGAAQKGCATRHQMEPGGGEPRSGRVIIDADALRSLHPALASRVARLALEPLASGRFIGFEHIQRFLQFVQHAAPGRAVSLPGQQAHLRSPSDRFGRAGTVVELDPEPPRRARSKRSEAGPVAPPSGGEVPEAGRPLPAAGSWRPGEKTAGRSGGPESSPARARPAAACRRSG